MNQMAEVLGVPLGTIKSEYRLAELAEAIAEQRRK